MSLKDVVGKLTDENNKLLGSAWFFSERYALTAAHCVKSHRDEPLFMSLLWDGVQTDIPVRLVATSDYMADIDAAVLTVGSAPHEIGGLVIPLSRMPPTRGKSMRILGYPARGQDDSAEAESVDLETAEIRCRINGYRTDHFIKLQRSSASFTQEHLRGMSGGVASHDMTYCDGIVTYAPSLPDTAYVMPIGHIAEHSEKVREALEASDHALPRQLVIDVRGAEVLWSGKVPPEEAGRLWNAAKPLEVLVVRGRRREYGPAADAIARLLKHTPANAILVDCVEDWSLPAAKLIDEQRIDYPARTLTCDQKAFGDLVHEILDRSILDLLSNSLRPVLEEGEIFDGLEIELQLRDAMRQEWERWSERFLIEPDKLRCFLVRTVSHSDTSSLDGPSLVEIGVKSLDSLPKATLFTLAVAASGVAVHPNAGLNGNVAVAMTPAHMQPGHSCGCKAPGGRNWVRAVRKHAWTVHCVFLPHLTAPYLDTLRKFGGPVLRRVSSTSPGMPPLVVTEDADFIFALEEGADAVRQYFERLCAERDAYSQDIKTPDRLVTNA